MIPLILSALAGLAEEYVLVRRALTVYRTIQTVDTIGKELELLSSEPTTRETSVHSDEIYFYLVGLGVYNQMYASSTKDAPEWPTIIGYVEEAVMSDTYRNSSGDAFNRLAAFITSFGRTMALRDPDSSDALSKLVLREQEQNKITDIVSAAVLSNSLVEAIKDRFIELTLPVEEVTVVVNLFKKGGEVPYLTAFRLKIAKDGVNLADSLVSSLYSFFLEHSNLSSAIITGEGEGSFSMNTVYLPYAKAKPISPTRNMYSRHSMTPWDIKEAESRILENRGYMWDDKTKTWMPKLQAILAAATRTAEGEVKTSEQRLTEIAKAVGSNQVAKVLASEKAEKLIKNIITKRVKRK